MQLPFAKLSAITQPREESVALVELMSALLLFAYPPEIWYAEPVFRALALLGIAFRAVRVSPYYWLLCAALWSATVVATWPWAGNHKYLVAYWCLTLAACRALPEARHRVAALGNAGRHLLGLAMGVAVVAKLLSSAYVSGDFFAFELLHFSLFHHLSVLVAGCQSLDLEQNRLLVDSMELAGVAGPVNEVRLTSCPGIAWFAPFMTWWTVGIEGALAVCFLLPRRSRRLDLASHALFALFVVTTYTVATVVWFGWTLCLLAIAHARQIGARGLCYLHIALIGLVIMYEMPVGDVLESTVKQLTSWLSPANARVV